MTKRYWITTLGCPKNQVDSDKLEGTLGADGMIRATRVEDADLVVVNTCAFIESAREESIATILEATETKRDDAKLVVTGCMAERYGAELGASLPEVDQVSGFGVPISLGARRDSDVAAVPSMDLLNLSRPPSSHPWAYVKVAEGCDRACGFCAIPSFRGKQRSRDARDILREVDELGVQEVVLIAQDLASYGNDRGDRRAIIPLVREISSRVARTRLLYLYPSDLNDELIDVILATGVPYFDLSLQHVSPTLLRRMRRWGNGDAFLERVRAIRARQPDAAFRSNFIVGYPGETESDHDALCAFIEVADMEWCSFFAFSPEEGTYAYTLDHQVPQGLRDERLAELREMQDLITARKRASLIGSTIDVLVDEAGFARSFREAPEIDGVVEIPSTFGVGETVSLTVVGASGPDLQAR